MASEEILPGSALNQVPLEQPADPQHTDSTTNSTNSKPFKHNSSSPSPSPVTPQVPLQVHVPAGLAAHPHASRTLPGGLLAQSPYGQQLPAGQAGLMPFPYGQQLVAAAAPRGLGFQPMQAGMPGMAAQPMMLPGGGLIRHPRRTMAPVTHPYQRVAAMPGAAAPQVQPYQMLAAGRPPVAQQQSQIIQTPYGQMLVPVSSAGLQYRLPAVHQPPPPQPAVAMDPTMAALYGQYQSSYPSAYLQQFQQPTMAALAAASAQYGAAAQYGLQPQYLSAAASREQQQQQLAAAYAARAGEQPQYYDPQKLLNAHYAQLLMPEQTNNSPAANGTTTEYSDQET